MVSERILREQSIKKASKRFKEIEYEAHRESRDVLDFALVEIMAKLNYIESRIDGDVAKAPESYNDPFIVEGW